jgi:NADPH2:quinone reductase
MKAAWYERQGAAREVLTVGEMADPEPGDCEVRIRLVVSGINPGDLKKRADAFGIGMPSARVVPHSDGAGVIDRVGPGVSPSRLGERVWCYGAQSYRAFGTAAQCTVVPAAQAVVLPAAVGFEIGACLGIPGITAHRAVHAGGGVDGQVLLVQGGGGAVGVFAVGLARRANATVLATVRSEQDAVAAAQAGAHYVVRTDGRSPAQVLAELRRLAPEGVQHIVEVAFDTNIDLDMAILCNGGSIAAYATGDPRPSIPFWDLLFKNARLLLLGSDDFPAEARREAAAAVSALLAGGWQGVQIAATFTLDEMAAAHEFAEGKRGPGRVVVRV